MKIKNRDHARHLMADAGVTRGSMTTETLTALRERINERMAAGGYIKDSLRMNVLDGKYPELLRCHAFYFDDREAVSFNPDGYIGIAGWADDKNVRPILDGIGDFLEDYKTMNKQDRKKSIGTLRLKGSLTGVSVSRTECDEHGHRSYSGAIFQNKNDFMKFIVAHYWGKPTNPNGGDT